MTATPAAPIDHTTMSEPLPPRERNVALDIIRGIAVFGLVWVNFGGTATTTVDRAARWIMVVFAAGKFYTLFSVLFGVTLAMQLERAAAAGARLTGWWLRRMAVLYGIGWVNLILVWGGDILHQYAVAGAALLVFARRSSRTLLVAAAAITIMNLPRESLSVLALRLTGNDVAPAKAHARQMPQEKLKPFFDALERGSYLDVVRTHWTFETTVRMNRSSQAPLGPLNLFPTGYLALFLVGLWAGRRRIIQAPDTHAAFLRRVAVIGGTLGLTLALLTAARLPFSQLAVGTTNTNYGRLLDDLSQPMLSFAYLAALLLLFRRDAWTDRFRWFSAVGRMGLTCYIMQWGIISFVRCNYGLGLENKLGQATCTALAILVFIAQVVFANWWLKRFSFGPVEWLWRTLSYGRLRKRVVIPSPAVG